MDAPLERPPLRALTQKQKQKQGYDDKSKMSDSRHTPALV